MKKLMILGITLCGALLALPALSEQADTQPAQPAQPVKAGPAKARVKAPAAPAKAPAAPVKAAPTKAGLVKAAPTKADVAAVETEEPEQAETAEGETGADEEAVGVGSLPTSVAGFAEAMQEQIEAIGGQPTCDTDAGRCRYQHHDSDGQRYEIQLWYGEPSRTIYIFVNHFATAETTNAATPVVVRHLAAINRTLGVARFEWNEADGEIRLSTVMNVDTNFDEHALRNLLRFVQDTAVRFRPQVARLLENHENAPEPPRPSPSDEAGAITDRSGYMPAIEEELRAMGFSPTCNADTGRCTFELDSEEARNVFNMLVQYNSQSNTVLVVADRFLTAPTENPRTDRLLQRMLSLNWQQLVPTFQWNSGDGVVRVVGAVNTDSNLDRHAFRSVVASVNQVSARHYRELRGMLNP